MQGIMHHVGIEVAGAAGADLDGRHPMSTDTLGIVFGFQITFNHGNLEFVSQEFHAGFQQSGFTGTR